MNVLDKVQKVIDGLAAESTRLHEHADRETVPDFRHRARSRAGFIDKVVKDLKKAIDSDVATLEDAWDAGVIEGHNKEGRLIDKRDGNPYSERRDEVA